MSYRVQLIISEDVESQQFGTNVINKVINPALSINAPLIPTALSFSVTAVVSEIEDTEKIKIVEIEVLNKNEKQIFSTGEVSVSLPPQVNDINFNINARNVLVEEAGEHYAVVKFNGTEIGRQIFDIKVNKPMEKN
ncbi:DUF6941 family protein [Enterococcus faecium]|uniref:DUF6941 family protein n=1 Tax=Enterococcus faecium TaxID=1352 RepID=UPI00257B8BAF|nr:hypothetical protein [Enterococcus faecium]